MRRILALTAGGALTVVPVTAFAATADNDDDAIRNPLTTASQALHPLERRARTDEAADKLRAARERVERKLRRERARERARKRRARERRARRAAATGRPVSSTGGGSAAASPALQSIARCESGGDPNAIGGGGQFRGKYQFTYSTWASVGGTGDPAAAPEAEQDRRAAMLYARAGASPWPVCGR